MIKNIAVDCVLFEKCNLNCPHSRMHQYINNNPLIMERYKKWL